MVNAAPSGVQHRAAGQLTAPISPELSGAPAPAIEPAAAPGGSAAPAPGVTDPALIDVLERNNRLLDAIITRPPAAAPAAAAPPPEPDIPASPPDPVIDPQGHARWVSARIERAERVAQRSIEQSRAEIESRQAMAELWQDFQREHPEEARLPELVLRALEVETNGTLRIGSDPSALKQRVAARVRERLSLVRGAQAGAPAASAATAANRTAGITGGSAPAAPKAPEKAEEPVRGFADQIKEMQIKSPYF